MAIPKIYRCLQKLALYSAFSTKCSLLFARSKPGIKFRKKNKWPLPGVLKAEFFDNYLILLIIMSRTDWRPHIKYSPIKNTNRKYKWLWTLIRISIDSKRESPTTIRIRFISDIFFMSHIIKNVIFTLAN